MFTSPGGVSPELDQPGFVGMQFQPELRKPLTKIGQEPLRILRILEADGEIVREAHDNHVPARVAAPPPPRLIHGLGT
jgi:hypothetical protein